MRGLLVALLLACSLVPPMASAQPVPPPAFWIDQPPMLKALVPDGEAAAVTLHWTYRYSTAVQPAASLVSPKATLVWQEPTCAVAGIAVTGALSQTFDLVPTTGAPPSEVEGESTFNVRASRDAPGERLFKCQFSGHVQANTAGVPESNEARIEALVEVAYAPYIKAETPMAVGQAGPQTEIRFDIELANLGNALSQVAFELTEYPPAGWMPLLPPPVAVASATEGSRNEAKVPFMVMTPYQEGWNEGEATFRLRATPVSTRDPSLRGEPVELTFVARVRGYYCSEYESCQAIVAEAKGPACKLERAECDRVAAEGEELLAQVRGSNAQASPSAWLAGLGALSVAAALRRRSA